MRWLPESPRARARLLRRALVVAALVAVGVLVAFFRNTGHSLQTPTNDKPVVVLHNPKGVAAPAAERAAAEQTLERFVQAAILRRDPARAWDLTTPHMRVGSTRDEWRRGEMPVVPYPSAEYRTDGLTRKYSYRGVLGYDVLVLPKSKQGDQQVYSCELHDLRGRWLVDFCYPRTTL
jgi:hypothetical protein